MRSELLYVFILRLQARPGFITDKAFCLGPLPILSELFLTNFLSVVLSLPNLRVISIDLDYTFTVALRHITNDSFNGEQLQSVQDR